MEDNWLTAYPPKVHDMTVTPKTKDVTVWLAREDVGLRFSFWRVTVTHLEKRLDQDRKRQQKIAAKQRQEWLAQLPSEQQAFLRESLRGDLSLTWQPPSWVRELPEEFREAYPPRAACRAVIS